MNKTGLYNQTTLDIYCIAQKNIEPNWHADAYAIVKMLLMCAVKKATVIWIQLQRLAKLICAMRMQRI